MHLIGSNGGFVGFPAGHEKDEQQPTLEIMTDRNYFCGITQSNAGRYNTPEYTT